MPVAYLEAKASRRQHDAGVDPYALVQHVALADDASGAEHREAADYGALADPGSLADDRSAHDGARLDVGALEQDAALDDGALPHAAAARERGTSADRRPVTDLALRRHRDGRQELDVFADPDRSVNVEVLESFPVAHGAGEDVVGGHQVAARGTYVPPVGARDVRPQAPLRLELGEDLALYGELLAARDHLQDLGLEDVDAGVYQVCSNLVGGRLLDKAVHEHVVVHLDEAVGRRVLDAGEGYRGEGVGLPVPVDEPLEVHAREHVAVYRHYRPPAPQVARGVL